MSEEGIVQGEAVQIRSPGRRQWRQRRRRMF